MDTIFEQADDQVLHFALVPPIPCTKYHTGPLRFLSQPLISQTQYDQKVMSREYVPVLNRDSSTVILSRPHNRGCMADCAMKGTLPRMRQYFWWPLTISMVKALAFLSKDLYSNDLQLSQHFLHQISIDLAAPFKSRFSPILPRVFILPLDTSLVIPRLSCHTGLWTFFVGHM